MQSDYLHSLLSTQLKLTEPVALYGRGLGGRVALLHALRHPQQTGALLLDNTPAGHKAGRTLSKRWYSSAVDCASIYNVRGMEYVAKEPRFAPLCPPGSANLEHLLRTPSDFFKLRMDTWGAALTSGSDPSFYPALGIEASRLHTIAAPALVGYLPEGAGGAEGLCSGAALAELNECFCSAVAGHAAVSAGMDEPAWVTACASFLSSLPVPLPAAPLRGTAAAAASVIVGASRSWARGLFSETSAASPPPAAPPAAPASPAPAPAPPSPVALPAAAEPPASPVTHKSLGASPGVSPMKMGRTCSASTLTELLSSISPTAAAAVTGGGTAVEAATAQAPQVPGAAAVEKSWWRPSWL